MFAVAGSARRGPAARGDGNRRTPRKPEGTAWIANHGSVRATSRIRLDVGRSAEVRPLARIQRVTAIAGDSIGGGRRAGARSHKREGQLGQESRVPEAHGCRP